MKTVNLSKTLQDLANQARCIDDADWGSERQTAALNEFFAHVYTIIGRRKFIELEAYCLKATTDEMIDEALRLVGTS